MRRQSEHFGDYRAAIERLEAMGLIYPSFESRADIAALVAERERDGPWPRDPDGAPLYPGTAREITPDERARRIAAGEPYALRLDMVKALARLASFASPLEGEVDRSRVSGSDREGGEQHAHARRSNTPLPIPPPQGGREESAARAASLTWAESGSGPDGKTGRIPANPANPAAWGDVVLARKDAPASYHLAVTLDDALQGVTDVVRGKDLFHSTSVHRLLQSLLGLAPPRYRHHRLVLDADGRKLSKSTAATALRQLRAEGLTPADIRRRVGLD